MSSSSSSRSSYESKVLVFIRCGSALGHVLVGGPLLVPGPLGTYAKISAGGDNK
jgi:hypothetical protein